MFGRTTFAALLAAALGVAHVVAETTDEYRARFLACTRTLSLVDPQPVFRWEYDDASFFNFSYQYDPTYCNSSIPINSIRLQDNVGGGLYTCTRQQFSPDRTTIASECRMNTR